eukprot:CAMPEP_0171116716 /NCGR_PEP_ID=MMETSP0766_2-20121228/90868_1 /TAXON_ID=439317 /ORGANISM="Gambierdiscus australes, Strain CAWD 149" /LENGTH=190 /DNA_ID=CAMNT_0011579171 /DNA_START=17 /DNA_END=590 /DNA_ORIENTATION=-
MAEPELWKGALELLPQRLCNRTIFAMLTSMERSMALQALPVVENALLFENFSRPLAQLGIGDARGPGVARGFWVHGPGTFALPRMERRLLEPKTCSRPISVWCLWMQNVDPHQTWTLAASSGASHGACARALSASAARCRRPARTAAVESSRWRMALETTRDQNSRQCLSISHATLGGGLSVRLWRAGAR